MITMKKVIILGTLVLSTVSHAAVNRMGATKGSAKKRVATMSAEVNNLQVPTAKNPDPALALGLGHNPAECPFKSQVAKNEDSAGVRYGQATPTHSVGTAGAQHNR